MASAVNWFDIPVTDMNRAKAFYSTLLGGELSDAAMGEEGAMAVLPYQDGVGGALMQGDGYAPSQQGSVVYLNGGHDLSVPLGKVEAAGGKVLMDKMSIGENGFIAFFLDTEGNRVGLHSMD
jgi:predicted enzyme related to lactoylglutathione lyase